MSMMLCLWLAGVFGWILFAVDILFQVFVIYLLAFHTYLACANLTTWECLSWDKISYLKLWPRTLGSPFNIGIKKNLICYFCTELSGDNYFVWRLPKRRPDIVKALKEKQIKLQQQRLELASQIQPEVLASYLAYA